MMNFAICTSQKILSQNSRGRDGVARHTYVRKTLLQGLGGNPEGKRPLRRTRGRWENDIKVDLTFKTQDRAEYTCL